MVFDSTVSELNDALYNPNSLLPMMGSLIMLVGIKAHMDDLDMVCFKF